jgi:hypothetical protein
MILIAVTAAVALAASCGMERRIIKKMQDLQEDLCVQADEFNRMIAWGYYDDASLMVVPERRADFLMQAEKVAARVKMESYKVTLCEVSSAPFPRVRGDVTPTPEPAPTPVATPRPAPEETTPMATPKLEMPKAWYGRVIVRYINLVVVPSNAVRSPLLRQYWVARDDTWFVDPDLSELLQQGDL